MGLRDHYPGGGGVLDCELGLALMAGDTADCTSLVVALQGLDCGMVLPEVEKIEKRMDYERKVEEGLEKELKWGADGRNEPSLISKLSTKRSSNRSKEMASLTSKPSM